jgi:hypothetical protein
MKTTFIISSLLFALQLRAACPLLEGKYLCRGGTPVQERDIEILEDESKTDSKSYTIVDLNSAKEFTLLANGSLQSINLGSLDTVGIGTIQTKTTCSNNEVTSNGIFSLGTIQILVKPTSTGEQIKVNAVVVFSPMSETLNCQKL